MRRVSKVLCVVCVWSAMLWSACGAESSREASNHADPSLDGSAENAQEDAVYDGDYCDGGGGPFDFCTLWDIEGEELVKQDRCRFNECTLETVCDCADGRTVRTPYAQGATSTCHEIAVEACQPPPHVANGCESDIGDVCVPSEGEGRWGCMCDGAFVSLEGVDLCPRAISQACDPTCSSLEGACTYDAQRDVYSCQCGTHDAFDLEALRCDEALAEACREKRLVNEK